MARVSDPVASSEAATPPASQLPIEGPRFLPWARPRRRAPTELFRVWHPHPPASDAGGHLSPGPARVGVGHVSRDARLRNPSPCILPGRSDPRRPLRAAFRSTFQPTGRLDHGSLQTGPAACSQCPLLHFSVVHTAHGLLGLEEEFILRSGHCAVDLVSVQVGDLRHECPAATQVTWLSPPQTICPHPRSQPVPPQALPMSPWSVK